MTKLQKAKVRGAYKSMIKAIAAYEEIAAEVLALNGRPQYEVEMTLFVRNRDSMHSDTLVDKIVVDSVNEAKVVMNQIYALATKLTEPAIEERIPHNDGSEVEVTYFSDAGFIVGDLYATYKEI